MVYVTHITSWIEYYESVQERCGEFDATCPQSVKDDPEQFYRWVKQQRQIEQNKLKSKR